MKNHQNEEHCQRLRGKQEGKVRDPEKNTKYQPERKKGGRGRGKGPPGGRKNYNSTKPIKHFKRELYLKTYHSRVDGNYGYNPCMSVPSTWMPKWWQIPNETPDKSRNLRQKLSLCFKRNLEDTTSFHITSMHYVSYAVRGISL